MYVHSSLLRCEMKWQPQWHYLLVIYFVLTWKSVIYKWQQSYRVRVNALVYEMMLTTNCMWNKIASHCILYSPRMKLTRILWSGCWIR